MERRGFLKGLTAAAVGWVAGGGIARETGLVPAYVGQIPFINEAEAAGLDVSFAIDAAATAQYQAATYPQSVAAGDPNPNGCVLWTRVEPSMLRPGLNVIGWQIGTDPGFTRGTIRIKGAATINAGRDYTVKLPIQTPALSPFTTYYYRFIYNGVASRVGRFKTMPQPGDTLNQLRLGYVVCQDYSNGFYNAYGFLAQEDVDAVVFLGDYIYEYLDDGTSFTPTRAPVRVVPPYPSGAKYPQNLEDYRHLYRTYRGDPQIQATHEKFAFIQLWDDHEFYNDSHQNYHLDTFTGGLTGNGPNDPVSALRKQANQAWAEHGLAATPFNAKENWERSIKVYRKFQFGNLADLIVTDERLYRDGPPCGTDTSERYQTTGCANVASPARTMLGAEQKQWFLDSVKGSSATWKIWANEVMVCQYLIGPPAVPQVEYFSLDQWDGYPAERADILGQIRDAGVKNFVVLSGDAHLYLASYLRTNFNNPAEAPMGVEFMVGAVSSGNYYDALVDAPTTTPLPNLPAGAQRAAQMGLPLDALSPLILAYNPHMVLWNGSTWGYAILTVTPQSAIVDYRVVSTVKEPTATLQQLASFTVPVNQVSISQTVVP